MDVRKYCIKEYLASIQARIAMFFPVNRKEKALIRKQKDRYSTPVWGYTRRYI
jgi:hypothetical protein